MCPARDERIYLIHCHYFEIVTLREEEKLNGLYLLLILAMKMLVLPVGARATA